MKQNLSQGKMNEKLWQTLVTIGFANYTCKQNKWQLNCCRVLVSVLFCILLSVKYPVIFFVDLHPNASSRKLSTIIIVLMHSCMGFFLLNWIEVFHQCICAHIKLRKSRIIPKHEKKRCPNTISN